jgi:hypothetical protein
VQENLADVRIDNDEIWLSIISTSNVGLRIKLGYNCGRIANRTTERIGGYHSPGSFNKPLSFLVLSYGPVVGQVVMADETSDGG